MNKNIPEAEKMLNAQAAEVGAVPPLEKISDAGNANLLVEAERDNLLYCFETKKWLVWDGNRWQIDEKQRARSLMEKTMRDRIAQVVASRSPKEIAIASGCLDTYRLTNGLHEAEKKLGVAAADLDTHPFLITFKNGTLDLETMTLGPHKRVHLITKMIHHNYNREAKLPRFLGLLEIAWLFIDRRYFGKNVYRRLGGGRYRQNNFSRNRAKVA
jgi:phage/plasmid-associated DNA primase